MNLRDLVDKQQQDQGLGDTVKRVISKTGIKPKKDCGCEGRRHKLNKLVPYRGQK